MFQLQFFGPAAFLAVTPFTNLCQKPVKHKHNELFSAEMTFFHSARVQGKKEKEIHIQNVMTAIILRKDGCQSLFN